MEAGVDWVRMEKNPVCVPLAIQADSVTCRFKLVTVSRTHVRTMVRACFYSEGTCVRAR